MSDLNFQDDIGDGVRLCPEDAAALDAILDGQRAEESESAGDAARQGRVRGWLKLLGMATLESPSPDLVARTLARVDAERRSDRIAAEKRTPEGEHVRPYERLFRMRYIREAGAMAVAAGLLLMVVTLGVSQARQSANRVACAANLVNFANALSTYGAANHQQLPALADSADGNWLHPNLSVVNAHSNVDNLLPLLSAGMIRPANLLCPARAAMGLEDSRKTAKTFSDSARGYSYVNLFGAHRPTWDHLHSTIVLADRNPLFDAAAESAAAEGNSANHNQRGNYLIRGDGAVTWEVSPNVGVGGDNIWTIAPGPEHVRFLGTEMVASVSDTFLAP